MHQLKRMPLLEQAKNKLINLYEIDMKNVCYFNLDSDDDSIDMNSSRDKVFSTSIVDASLLQFREVEMLMLIKNQTKKQKLKQSALKTAINVTSMEFEQHMYYYYINMKSRCDFEDFIMMKEPSTIDLNLKEVSLNNIQ